MNTWSIILLPNIFGVGQYEWNGSRIYTRNEGHERKNPLYDLLRLNNFNHGRAIWANDLQQELLISQKGRSNAYNTPTSKNF